MSARSLLLIISLSSVQFVTADNVFTMDDISSSLQMEYQSQLVLHPQAKHKVVPRESAKNVSIKKSSVRKNPVRNQQPAQRKIIQSALVRQPATKAPIPDVEELFEAATYGNVNQITRLLQQGINVNAANSERETALHMAAANGRYPAVIYLLNHGANINARTIKNWTPIHHATRFRKANIANYLMKKGASPYTRTSDGLSAIDMARTLHDQQLLRVLGAQ